MEQLFKRIQIELDMDYNDVMDNMASITDVKELKKCEKRLNLISNIKKYNTAYFNIRKVEAMESKKETDDGIVIESEKKTKRRLKKAIDEEEEKDATLKN
jgi:hypothetical protein